MIKQLVKPGMIVLDLGANVGYYTKILSTLVGHDGHVIAFEPHPKVFRILSKNVAALSNVTSVQLSVSDKNEKQTLYDFLPWSGGSSLRYNNNERMWYNKQFPRIVSGADYATYAVMTTTVDSWLAENNVNTVDFVKMDIEGAEFNALRGMIKTTRKNEKLIMVMELNPVALESFGFDSQTVLSELHELGFRRVSIIGINGKLDPLDQHEFEHLTRKLKDTYSVANLLCIKH
ncbi:MAG: FkbM family methyltransferase [Candidatus Nitrosotenuis sp.]